jgi:hypothetical protein
LLPCWAVLCCAAPAIAGAAAHVKQCPVPHCMLSCCCAVLRCAVGAGQPAQRVSLAAIRPCPMATTCGKPLRGSADEPTVPCSWHAAAATGVLVSISCCCCALLHCCSALQAALLSGCPRPQPFACLRHCWTGARGFVLPTHFSVLFLTLRCITLHEGQSVRPHMQHVVLEATLHAVCGVPQASSR